MFSENESKRNEAFLKKSSPITGKKTETISPRTKKFLQNKLNEEEADDAIREEYYKRTKGFR